MSGKDEPVPWWFLLLAPLCAFGLVFAAFSPALEGQFLEWDDAPGVSRNADLRLTGSEGLAWRFTTRHMGHYQPLSWWSLSLDVDGAPEREPGGEIEGKGVAELGPREATRCHRTNLLLHALGAVAFALLAERLLRAAFAKSSSPPSNHALAAAALFASLAWALHPLRVESVAWITERRDVLSAVPLLASIYMYVLWAERRELGGRVGFYVAAVFLLLLSLLAKAWGIVVPALLIVIDFYPLRRHALSWRAVGRLAFEKLPFFVLAAGFAAIAAWAQASLADAMPSMTEHSLLERALQAAYGVCFYVWKSCVPTGLLPLYELPQDLSIRDGRFLWPLVALAVGASVIFALRRRLPAVGALAIAGVLCVLPVLGFAQAGPQLVADRYTYLFGFAFALGIAGCALVFLRVVPWIPWLCAVLLLSLFGVATRAQSAIWRDTQSLWAHVLEREPAHLVANLSMGNELARAALLEDTMPKVAQGMRAAAECFTAGFRATPDARFASKLALVHRALAQLEPERSDEHLRAAQDFSEQAVKLAIATGRVSPAARFERGLQLLSAGRLEEALVELEWYVSVRPDDPRGMRALEDARSRK